MASVPTIPPTIHSYVSHYFENKKIRYSGYGLTILAVGVAAHKFGHLKIGFTLVSAGAFVQCYKINELAQEIKKTPRISDAVKREKISRITDHIFTLSLIWGIVISGLNLSLICHEGKLLLRGVEAKDLRQFYHTGLKNPLSLLDKWVKNAPHLLSRTNSLASLGCIAIPQASNFISWSDDFFYGKQLLANTVYQLCEKAVNILAAVENITLLSLFFMIKDTIQAIDLSSYLSRVMSKVPSPMISTYSAFRNSLPLLYRFPHITFADLNNWVRSFSNPQEDTPLPAAHPKNSSSLEKTKKIANYFFFYAFNLSLLGTQIYYHPLPTGLFFGLGLLYPTSFQTEQTIQRTWTIVPDFIALPVALKCRYILDRVSATLVTLKWWNYPAASLNGVYLAESARYLVSRN
jgi:hypothetical protein